MATINRRTFMASTAAAGLAPAVIVQSGSRPTIISSTNGHKFKNGGAQTGLQIAYERMMRGDDVLDAVIACVNVVELDPLDDSVGYGGLPNADGVVQLDSCCMHGPKRRAGGVAALEGVKTPSLVARAVMDHSDHHLLVGPGAQQFARTMGFEILPDLNTPNSRAKYLEWKRLSDPLHYIKDPEARLQAEQRVRLEMIAAGLLDE